MSILKAIKTTVEYSQRFGGNLKQEELFERLISENVYKREEIFNFPFPVSKKNNQYLDKKIKKAKRLAKVIDKNFKDVLFVGITGSVAAGNPKKNCDIDLMIITKANKLWITRLKMRFFVFKNGIPHRRYGKKEENDEFCFNLWLDETSLKLGKSKINLRNAMDLIMMKPLVNKNKTYEKFFLENDWAKKFVATGYGFKLSKFKFPTTDRKKNNYLDIIVNFLVFCPQFWHMRKKIRGEKVGLHEAFFHR